MFNIFSRKVRLRKQFLQQRSNSSLQMLIQYYMENEEFLEIEEEEFLEALFSFDYWELDEKPLSFLLRFVTVYLLDSEEPQLPRAWSVLLETFERSDQELAVEHERVAKALYRDAKTGVFNKLAETQLNFLLSNFPRHSTEFLTPGNDSNLPEIVNQLININYACRQMEEAGSRKEKENLLLDLMDYCQDENIIFPIWDETLRDYLFSIDFWDKELPYLDSLYEAIEDYLFGSPHLTKPNDWKMWLRASASMKRVIPVLQPRASQSLKLAQNLGKLQDLPKAEYDYLLKSYLHHYGNVLESLTPGDSSALPMLLEYASIMNIVGQNEDHHRILEKWTKDLPPRPRSLANLREEQIFLAPVVGVGSPHTVAITQYFPETGLSHIPVRITSAGATGDETLNNQIFTALFAAALACDSEPTIVTTVGSVLSLKNDAESINTREENRVERTSRDRSFMRVVIGPDGPKSPQDGMPAVGVEPGEAMSLIRDMFSRFEESTGIVQMKQWQLQDGEHLDKLIMEALQEKTRENRVINSTSKRSEGSGLIHITPMLWRDNENNISTATIQIPYHLLNAEKVFELVKASRSAYMARLIAACERRKAYAERVYKQNESAYAFWQTLSDEERRLTIKDRPYVEVRGTVNFELGISIQMAKPEKYAREEFETFHRPSLIKDSRAFAEKYAELAVKLHELDSEGGHADILTFKLLIDSLIRRAQLPVLHEDLKESYDEWVENNADIIWRIINSWAEEHNITTDILASDNVIYNASLDLDSSTINIELWLMLDLHDFVVYIDQSRGIIEVRPGGKTPNLTEILIPDSSNNVMTPTDLLSQFYDWVDDTLNLQISRAREEDRVRSEIMGDANIHTLIQLRIAQSFLGRGYDDQAIEIINTIRKKDLAPIYFWGAVACQYSYIKDKNAEFKLRLEGLGQAEKANRLVNLSVQSLIDDITPQRQIVDQPMIFGGDEGPLIITPGRSRIPLTSDARRFFDQMIDKDPELAEGLKASKDVMILLRESLGLTSDDESRITAAVSALSALELLKLAENMKDTAKELPFTGMWTHDLQVHIQEIVDNANALKFRPTSVSNEINELLDLTKGISSKEIES